MQTFDFTDEFILIQELKCKNLDAFSWLCKEYSEDLLMQAYKTFGDVTIAVETVGNLFIALWEGDKLGNITLPIDKYLEEELLDLYGLNLVDIKKDVSFFSHNKQSIN